MPRAWPDRQETPRFQHLLQGIATPGSVQTVGRDFVLVPAEVVTQLMQVGEPHFVPVDAGVLSGEFP